MIDFKCSQCGMEHRAETPKTFSGPTKVPCACGHILSVTRLFDDFEVYEIGIFHPPPVPVYDYEC